MTMSVNAQSNIDIIRKRLKLKGFILEDVIKKIHIDSEEFDPYTLI
jgi:hypothetical protein